MESDWFSGREALAHVLPVDALTGHHGIFVDGRERVAARAANGRLAVQSLSEKLIRHSIRNNCGASVPVTRAMLEEMAEGLGHQFSPSLAEAAAVKGATGTLLDKPGPIPTAGANLTVSSVLKQSEAKTHGRKPTSTSNHMIYQLRMACSMCVALSHSSGEGGTGLLHGEARDAMLQDILGMLREMVEDVKAERQQRESCAEQPPKTVASGGKDNNSEEQGRHITIFCAILSTNNLALHTQPNL